MKDAKSKSRGMFFFIRKIWREPGNPDVWGLGLLTLALVVILASCNSQNSTPDGIKADNGSASRQFYSVFISTSPTPTLSPTPVPPVWTQAASAAGFSGRYDHASAVFNNAMWVIGGYDGAYKNDVWSSTDGTTWNKVLDHAPFSARRGHGVVVLNGVMYVMGGYNGSYLNDGWSTTDGINWTQMNITYHFPARAEMGCFVDHGVIYVAGGTNGSNLSDVWKWNSPHWLVITSAAFSPRSWFGYASFPGASKGSYVVGNDSIEASSNGAPWNQLTGSPAFGFLKGLTAVARNSVLHAIGGINGSGIFQNTVWDSLDMGQSWSISTSSPGFAPRAGHTSIVFNNNIWVIGGETAVNGPYLNDVWYLPQ